MISRQCLGCSGLIPDGVNCPNCEVSRRGGLRTLVVAGTIAVASLSACPQPVYGAACVSKPLGDGGFVCCNFELPDGGDATRDPSNVCYDDGGTP
ncbi:MAG: hypothetical protein JNM17_02920 [Archangium sp.]|nr:hypothetical protein [Archangium sp.]